jgi:hypothetical protein
MTIERRVPEASSLRSLFQDLWDFLSDLFEEREGDKQFQERVSSAIEEVVEQTDARIRALGSYKKSLRDDVHALLEHVEELVGGMPSALTISQEAYANNPVVSSLFVDNREMQQLFSRSKELRGFFSTPDTMGLSEAFLLLFLDRQQKTTLGMGLKDDQLIRDMKQTTVSFSHHHLVAPCGTEEASRSALKKVLFDSVVQTIRKELNCFGSGENGRAPDVLQQMKNRDPQACLERLHAALNPPTELVRIQQDRINVSRLGILLPPDSDESGVDLSLHEVEIGEQPSQVVWIVKYPRDEILSASDLNEEFDPKAWI